MAAGRVWRNLVLAQCVDIKDAHFAYYACTVCYTKILRDDRTDTWVCIKCRRQYHASRAQMRYCLALTIADGTAQCEVTVFGRNVEPYFGSSATHIHRYAEEIVKTFSSVDKDVLLLRAMRQVFAGKCFYFGFKTARRRPVDKQATGKPTATTLATIVEEELLEHPGRTRPAKSQTSPSTGHKRGLIALQMLSPDQHNKDSRKTVVDVLRECVSQLAYTSDRKPSRLVPSEENDEETRGTFPVGGKLSEDVGRVSDVPDTSHCNASGLRSLRLTCDESNLGSSLLSTTPCNVSDQSSAVSPPSADSDDGRPCKLADSSKEQKSPVSFPGQAMGVKRLDPATTGAHGARGQRDIGDMNQKKYNAGLTSELTKDTGTIAHRVSDLEIPEKHLLNSDDGALISQQCLVLPEGSMMHSIEIPRGGSVLDALADCLSQDEMSSMGSSVLVPQDSSMTQPLQLRSSESQQVAACSPFPCEISDGHLIPKMDDIDFNHSLTELSLSDVSQPLIPRQNVPAQSHAAASNTGQSSRQARLATSSLPAVADSDPPLTSPHSARVGSTISIGGDTEMALKLSASTYSLGNPPGRVSSQSSTASKDANRGPGAKGETRTSKTTDTTSPESDAGPSQPTTHPRTVAGDDTLDETKDIDDAGYYMGIFQNSVNKATQNSLSGRSVGSCFPEGPAAAHIEHLDEGDDHAQSDESADVSDILVSMDDLLHGVGMDESSSSRADGIPQRAKNDPKGQTENGRVDCSKGNFSASRSKGMEHKMLDGVKLQRFTGSKQEARVMKQDSHTTAENSPLNVTLARLTEKVKGICEKKMSQVKCRLSFHTSFEDRESPRSDAVGGSLIRTSDSAEQSAVCWSQMPDSEDLDKFLGELDYQQGWPESPGATLVDVTEQGDEVIGSLFAGPKSPMVGPRPSVKGGSAAGRISDGLVMEDLPYSEDLEAFLQDLEQDSAMEAGSPANLAQSGSRTEQISLRDVIACDIVNVEHSYSRPSVRESRHVAENHDAFPDNGQSGGQRELQSVGHSTYGGVSSLQPNKNTTDNQEFVGSSQTGDPRSTTICAKASKKDKTRKTSSGEKGRQSVQSLIDVSTSGSTSAKQNSPKWCLSVCEETSVPPSQDSLRTDVASHSTEHIYVSASRDSESTPQHVPPNAKIAPARDRQRGAGCHHQKSIVDQAAVTSKSSESPLNVESKKEEPPLESQDLFSDSEEIATNFPKQLPPIVNLTIKQNLIDKWKMDTEGLSIVAPRRGGQNADCCSENTTRAVLTRLHPGLAQLRASHVKSPVCVDDESLGSVDLFGGEQSVDLFDTTGNVSEGVCSHSPAFGHTSKKQESTTRTPGLAEVAATSKARRRKSVHFPTPLCIEERISIIDIKMKFRATPSLRRRPDQSCLKGSPAPSADSSCDEGEELTTTPEHRHRVRPKSSASRHTSKADARSRNLHSGMTSQCACHVSTQSVISPIRGSPISIPQSPDCHVTQRSPARACSRECHNLSLLAGDKLKRHKRQTKAKHRVGETSVHKEPADKAATEISQPPSTGDKVHPDKTDTSQILSTALPLKCVQNSIAPSFNCSEMSSSLDLFTPSPQTFKRPLGAMQLSKGERYESTPIGAATCSGKSCSSRKALLAEVDCPHLGSKSRVGVNSPSVGSRIRVGVNSPNMGSNIGGGVNSRSVGSNIRGGVNSPSIGSKIPGGVISPSVKSNIRGGVDSPTVGSNSLLKKGKENRQPDYRSVANHSQLSTVLTDTQSASRDMFDDSF